MKTTFFEQFSPEQLKKQYAVNAKQLRHMADKALLSNDKLRGFTFEYLDKKASEYKLKSL